MKEIDRDQVAAYVLALAAMATVQAGDAPTQCWPRFKKAMEAAETVLDMAPKQLKK